jgi:hypothetical protein
MNYFPKSFTANRVWALLLIAGVFTLTSMTQSRTASFSGEWKLNESKTVDGNFLCSYDVADRMWSKSMKIADKKNVLTIDVSNTFGKEIYKGQERLTFDGNGSEVNYGNRPDSNHSKKKILAVKRSGDGQTITINSFVLVKYSSGEKFELNVKEVWKLINGGRSISVEYDVRSTSLVGDRYERRIYDKVS